MKKLYTMLFVLMLSLSTIGVFNIAPVSAEYVNLTIDYYPDTMPEPTMSPSVGTHSYTTGSEINITTPAIVNGTTGVRYVFKYWNKTDVNGTELWHGGNPSHTTPPLTTDEWTYTAWYTVQYLLTVITQCDVPNIWDSGTWYENTTSRWFDENATAYAGVMKNNPHDWVSLGVYKRCYFINWTGDATGKIDNVFWHSDPITMDEPKTATAEWVVRYRLWTDKDSEYAPWGPGSNWYDPDERGWYDNCTDVDLTAPTYDNENPNRWRWRFDYWEVERWNGTAWDPEIIKTENITVHLGPGIRATVYFWLQYYLTVIDSPSWLDTGVETQSRYVDYCSNATVYIPTGKEFFDVGGGFGYRFRRWLSSVGPNGAVNATTFKVHITGETTLTAKYKRMYRLCVKVDPPGVGITIPPGPCTGWYYPSTTVVARAPPNVDIDPTSRWHFVKWMRDAPPGGPWFTPNLTITMDQPKNFTAHYQLEWYIEWDHDPTTITVTGSPGFDWRVNGSSLWYGLPNTDTTGEFQFYYWKITQNAVTTEYSEGQNPVNLGLCTGPVSGTAYYENKTRLYITPHYVEYPEDPYEHPYCQKFNVSIVAANFNAERVHPVDNTQMDIYGFDITVTFPNDLLEIQKVILNLEDFFYPNDFYWFDNRDTMNTDGYYHLVASVKGNYTGFQFTKVMFTLEFHIIKEFCYPDSDWDWIYISSLELRNAKNEKIRPELFSWADKSAKYVIKSKKPELHFDSDYIHAQTYPYEFDVDVVLMYGVKVHDFYVTVKFDPTQIMATSVTIGTYLPGPYAIYKWQIKTSGKVIVQVALAQGEPPVNCSGVLFTIHFKVVKTVHHPNHLTSKLEFVATTHISVLCPTSRNQELSIDLKGEDGTYLWNPWPGDLDFDGCVTVLDLQLVKDKWGTATYDMNGDGDTDLYELVFVALRFNTGPECP